MYERYGNEHFSLGGAFFPETSTATIFPPTSANRRLPGNMYHVFDLNQSHSVALDFFFTLTIIISKTLDDIEDNDFSVIFTF